MWEAIDIEGQGGGGDGCEEEDDDDRLDGGGDEAGGVAAARGEEVAVADRAEAGRSDHHRGGRDQSGDGHHRHQARSTPSEVQKVRSTTLYTTASQKFNSVF